MNAAAPVHATHVTFEEGLEYSIPTRPDAAPQSQPAQALDRHELINGCQGLVRSIAWKIRQRLPSHVDLDDLIGYGQIGLAEAARDYDPLRGTQFTTFAYYRVRGSILDGLGRMVWFRQSDFNRGRYERLANDVLAKDDVGSSDQLTADLNWFKEVTSSLAVVYLLSQGAHADTEPPDEFAANIITPDEQAETHDLVEKLRRVIANLPEDARQLIEGTYFEGLTIKGAGERIGISKAWASRLHANTLKKLGFALAE